MSIRRFGCKRVVRLLVIAGFTLGFSLSSLAATAEVEINSALLGCLLS